MRTVNGTCRRRRHMGADLDAAGVCVECRIEAARVPVRFDDGRKSSSIASRLRCLFRRRHSPKSSTVLEDGSGRRLVRCMDCDRVLASTPLEPAEVCAIAGHDPRPGYVDRVDGCARDERTGELVELRLFRILVCARCETAVESAIPPELVPSDVFERVEAALLRSKANVAERIEIDLSGRDGAL